MGLGAIGPEGLTGQSVAGYRLDQLLGVGATGAVFLGTRLPETASVAERTGEVPAELPQQAAIKLLILPWQVSPEERKSFHPRFVREAQTLQRLQHRHILSVLTYGEDLSTGLSYMILPYMSGGTLASKIASAGAGLPLDEVTSYLTQIAAALDYAHSQGVIHRDIKPGNVLLDGAGHLYLADFSIVRLVADEQTKLTTTGRVMGTPSYMAPEQISGAGTLGPACDIYSLGMVVYEMVTGRVAFDSGTLMELIRQHLQDEPPAPRQLRSDLPPPAEAAILRALAKKPAERFATATDFAQAFADGLRGEWAAGLTAYAPGAKAAAMVDVHSALTAPAGAPLPHARQRSGAGPLMRLGILLACLLLIVGIAGSALGILPISFMLLGLPAARQAPTQPAAHATSSAASTGTSRATATSTNPSPGGRSGENGGSGPATGTGGSSGGHALATATPSVANPTPAPPSIYGDGSDGPLSISTYVMDSPLDATCSGSAGSLYLAFDNASGPFVNLAGKPVLIHQTQGSGAGTWMRTIIISAPGTNSGTLKLATPLNASYTTGAQVIVLRQYTNVIISAGATWAAKPWNGSTGGILAFVATGTVSVSGVLSARGAGFRGGKGSKYTGNQANTAQQGEGLTGTGGASQLPNTTGGGGSWQDDIDGGGGGHAAAGQGGNTSDSGGDAGAVGTDTSDLSIIQFGGGGGGGLASSPSNASAGGTGGTGGGIIYMAVAGITLTGGAITAAGVNGANGVGSDHVSGGGGGAGGAILIRTQNAGLGGGTTSVAGGSGGTTTSPGTVYAGANGRIFVG